jgi:hypothetical protein
MDTIAVPGTTAGKQREAYSGVEENPGMDTSFAVTFKASNKSFLHSFHVAYCPLEDKSTSVFPNPDKGNKAKYQSHDKRTNPTGKPRHNIVVL